MIVCKIAVRCNRRCHNSYSQQDTAMTLRTATLLALMLLAAGCQPPGDPHSGGFPPPVV